MHKTHTLSNGIKVITRHMEGLRSFSMGVFINACSNFEEENEIGISHLIEHMMFKGTEKYSAKQIAEIMDNIGGSMNAYTSKDCTVYYAKVLYEHAPIAIDLLSEMLIKSEFNALEIKREIKVVQEEIAMYEDSPEDVAYDIFQALVYKDHPLAHPVLGYNQGIEKLDRVAILDYIKRYYCTENTVISVAGYLPDDIIEQLEFAFKDYNKCNNKKLISKPYFNGGYNFAFKDIEQNHLCLGFESVPYGHKDHYAILLLSNYFGGSSSSMLFQTIREDNGLAYSIYSHPTFFINAGHITVYLSYKPQNEEKIITLIAQCIKDLKDAFTEEVLKSAKMQLKGTYLLGLEGSSSIMNTLGKRAIYGVQLQTMDEIINAINGITLEQIKSLIDGLYKSEVALSIVGQVDDAHVKHVYDRFKTLMR